MTEETSSTERDEPQGPLAGERLAAARRERDISVLDIAKELHLDEPKVRALEENKFETLGAPVFAKGHLRKYAELVGVPIEDVLTDYYSMNRAVGAPPVVGAPRKHARDLKLGRWVVAVVAVLAIAAAAYWWLGRVGDRPVVDADTAPETQLAPPPQDTGPPAADEPAPSPEPTATESPTADVDVDAPDTSEPVAALPDAGTDSFAAAPVASSDQAAAAADSSQITLAMRFSGDCWTEVTDAAGSRLFFDLGVAGRRVSVSGDPPLRVLFGNGENVTVTVDGRDFPILDSMRRGQTARFTINSQ